MSYTPTSTEITKLRRMIGEYPITSSNYSDSDLSDVIAEREGDLHAAAADVWGWKAAAVASLIDWSADGGSYDQSVLYDRYTANAEAERKQSAALSAMIVDPTLKEVE